jgi:PhnB protein
MDAGYKPDGYNAVSPYLLVKDVRAMLDFLSHAFGATELRRQADAEGAIRHAEVRIGDSVLMVGFRPWAELPTSSVHVYVDDVDKVYARALDQGAASLAAPRDLPYGDRSAGVRDEQGNYWWIGTRLSGTGS